MHRAKASLLFGLAGFSGTAQAQTTAPTATLPSVVVVGSTPLIAHDLDRDQVPAATRVLSASDINRIGIPDLIGATLANVPSATITTTKATSSSQTFCSVVSASPVAGTPEGLAVYVNGARFNDAFGAELH